jgi:CheY-like chemotaxis protein
VNNMTLILVVEDDRVDAMTIERVLKMELKITNPVQILGDGVEALEFLRANENKRPGLILLDLNMPRMGGLELLEILKKDPDLRKVPVVILTTSNEEKDKMKSYDCGIAGYMVKPVDYAQFVEVVRMIGLYWTLSEVPG